MMKTKLIFLIVALSVAFRVLLIQNLTAAAQSDNNSDISAEYQTASDWIWENRIKTEKSMENWSTIYDQIIAGNGTLQYILLWQSYEPITLEQRKKLPEMLENALNQWTDHLVGYDDWPYEHIYVKVVGYAAEPQHLLFSYISANKIVEFSQMI